MKRESMLHVATARVVANTPSHDSGPERGQLAVAVVADVVTVLQRREVTLLGNMLRFSCCLLRLEETNRKIGFGTSRQLINI